MKFYYKDKVKVTDGFYRGVVGTVTSYFAKTKPGEYTSYSYTVCINGVFINGIDEHNLEKITENEAQDL